MRNAVEVSVRAELTTIAELEPPLDDRQLSMTRGRGEGGKRGQGPLLNRQMGQELGPKVILPDPITELSGEDGVGPGPK